MDEPTLTPSPATAQDGTTPESTADAPTSPAEEPALARGSGHISEQPPMLPEHRERSEHSVMEGLPEAKTERIASMRRDLAELQRHLIDAEQRIATELQGRADDAERFEALEARVQEHELKAQQDATRTGELETEVADLRSQLVNATTAAEELRRDADAQIADARRQHREATERLEAEGGSLQEAKTLLATRDTELATRTSERDTEQSTRSQLERELEDERKRHRELADQLELQFASLRDAKTLIATRDRELSAMMSEGDALKVNLDQAQRDLDGARASVRDVANLLVGLGQNLLGGVGVAQPVSVPKPADPPPKPADPPAKRTLPPPLPPRPAIAHTEPPPVETILEVTEQPTISRFGSGLLMIGGVLLSCVLTIVIMKGIGSKSTGANDGQHIGAPPAAAVAAPLATEATRQAASGPVMHVVDSALPSTSPHLPAPSSDTDVSARPHDELATPPTATATAPAETKTDGVILLPEAASGHRLFVDGRVVEVKSSRAVVPCGAHEVRIGSSGAVQKLDVECGGETTLPADPANR